MKGRDVAATALVTLLAAFVALQVVRRPSLVNPEAPPHRGVRAHVQIPADIDTILRRACYDCHSNETRWPIYSRVAPVSWLIASDVRQGRADLNFSDWNSDPNVEPTPSQRLGGICSDLRKGIMPPRFYRMLHPPARLSTAQVERVCEWTRVARAGLPR